MTDESVTASAPATACPREPYSQAPLIVEPWPLSDASWLRSGVTWIPTGGHACRAGDSLAIMNLGVSENRRRDATHAPFAQEDLRMTVVAGMAGTPSLANGASIGGWRDLRPYIRWDEPIAIGSMRPRAPGRGQIAAHRTMWAGRRIFTTWYDRERAWWNIPASGAVANIVALGICDVRRALVGDRDAFADIARMRHGPTHLALFPDPALTFSSPVLTQHLDGPPTDVDGIVGDLGAWLARPGLPPAGSPAPACRAWFAMSALMNALTRSSPLTDACDVATAAGVRRLGPANIVLVSAVAELALLLRHKRLGYLMTMHEHTIVQHGAGFLAWVRESFEPVARSVDEMVDDVGRFARLLKDRTGAHLVVANIASQIEQIYNYAHLPPGEFGGVARSRALNLGLAELARRGDLSILDNDGIAAEFGSSQSVQGVHGSGQIMAAIRSEFVRIVDHLAIVDTAGP
jgi:hypothetical protein